MNKVSLTVSKERAMEIFEGLQCDLRSVKTRIDNMKWIDSMDAHQSELFDKLHDEEEEIETLIEELREVV